MLRSLLRYLVGSSREIDEVLVIAHFIAKEIRTMSTQLAALQVQVAENNTVVGSALTLIQGLRARRAGPRRARGRSGSHGSRCPRARRTDDLIGEHPAART